MNTKTLMKYFDTAGWLFWAVMFVLLLGPCMYGSWAVCRPGTALGAKISIGAVSAAIIAGIVAWAVNAVVEKRRKRKKQAERKKARKKK